MVSLRVAAEQTGESVIRLGRWCATGQLRCERDGDEWLIHLSEIPRIAAVAAEHRAAVEDRRVTALAVPAPAAPPDLAAQVARRLGLETRNVSATPLVIDGVEYVVAVWPGSVAAGGGLPALEDLAEDLGAELLDGEVKRDR